MKGERGSQARKWSVWLWEKIGRGKRKEGVEKKVEKHEERKGGWEASLDYPELCLSFLLTWGGRGGPYSTQQIGSYRLPEQWPSPTVCVCVSGSYSMWKQVCVTLSFFVFICFLSPNIYTVNHCSSGWIWSAFVSECRLKAASKLPIWPNSKCSLHQQKS